jgi:hypothetical protein
VTRIPPDVRAGRLGATDDEATLLADDATAWWAWSDLLKRMLN